MAVGHWDCYVKEASAYAWGRSDAGENLDANDIWEFAVEYANMEVEFVQRKRTNLPSVVTFFEQTFHPTTIDNEC